ncbi:MAG: hypothetical protein AVDCRST_MAG02-2090, partial [uncultured Rubrobacteraceae bacterium]
CRRRRRAKPRRPTAPWWATRPRRPRAGRSKRRPKRRRRPSRGRRPGRRRPRPRGRKRNATDSGARTRGAWVGSRTTSPDV